MKLNGLVFPQVAQASKESISAESFRAIQHVCQDFEKLRVISRLKRNVYKQKIGK